MRIFDVLLQEYEGVRNWNVDVQKMASTKKSNWKLMMYVVLGHTNQINFQVLCVGTASALKGLKGYNRSKEKN
eukprot:2574136-Ditylum_brightwellii.AAC.1